MYSAIIFVQILYSFQQISLEELHKTIYIITSL
jgi:hypothetical protein